MGTNGLPQPVKIGIGVVLVVGWGLVLIPMIVMGKGNSIDDLDERVPAMMASLEAEPGPAFAADEPSLGVHPAVWAVGAFGSLAFALGTIGWMYGVLPFGPGSGDEEND